MKKLGAVFYLILAVLFIAVLVMLSLWARTGRTLYLYLMLGAFGLYLIHIVLSLSISWKDIRGGEALRSKYLMLLNHFQSEIVYITYLGNERRIRKPSKTRRDYLIEFYEPTTDIELLKKHIWFGLSEAEEQKLKTLCVGSEIVSFSFLADIRQRKVMIQAGFLQAALPLRHFEEFLRENEIIPYGE